MLIISNYKDYYDYISYIYGIDNKIIYNRNIKIQPNFITIFGECELYLPNISLYHNKDMKYISNYTYDNKYVSNIDILSVCANLYLKIDFVDSKLESKYLFIQNDIEKLYTTQFYWKIFTKEIKFGNNSTLLELSKIIKQPVFIIKGIKKFGSNKYEFYIDETIPNLNDTKISKIVSPEQIYQNISQFISLYFNSNEPPIEITNREKIIKSGFDLKTSFRGK